MPYIPQGCDQQGRQQDGLFVQAAEASTEIGAEQRGVRGPLPHSVGRWARVLYGALGVLVVCIALGSAAALTFNR